MHEVLVTILGTTASALATVSLLPQVVWTWRTRSAGDISAAWLAIAMVSMAFWIWYDSLVDAQAVVRSNAPTAVEAAFIFTMKVKLLRRLPAPAGASGEWPDGTVSTWSDVPLRSSVAGQVREAMIYPGETRLEGRSPGGIS